MSGGAGAGGREGEGEGEKERRREGAGIGGKPGGRGQGGQQRDGGRDGGGGWRGVTAQEGGRGEGRLEGCRVRALLLSESLPLFTPLDSPIQFKLKKKKTYLNNNPGKKKIFSSDLNK